MDALEFGTRLVIGLDFGTTFSGIAFALDTVEDPLKAIEVITSWPGANSITSDKVPSELSYSRAIRWGFEVHPEEARLRCMKLLLEACQKLPSYVSSEDTYNLLLRSDKRARDVVKEYLAALYHHTIETLKCRYGSVFVNTTGLDFVLTVPAVWSDGAKAATLKAALKAGIPNVRLVSKPEAAAAYALQSIQPNHLREGNNFIVYDAGGGTVDLISFEIKQLKPLKLQELAHGSGGMCGSVLLNLRFEQCIRARMGHEAFDTMKKDPRGNRNWQIALAYFEEKVKRRYDNDGRPSFNIPLPGVRDNPNAGIDFGFLTLTNSEVQGIFEPIVTEVIELVEEQMSRLLAHSKPVNGVLLVGGFGQSSYVAKRLKQYFTGDPPPYSKTDNHPPGNNGATAFEVMQPPNAWTAVVRGAVLLGIEVKDLVLYRKSRRHYGIKCNQVFDPHQHPASCQYLDVLEGIYHANNCLPWFIRKNEQVSSERPILFPFYWTRLPQQFGPKPQHIMLCICESDVAPAGLHSDADNSTVRTLCRSEVDLSIVPQHLWAGKIGLVRYDRLDCKVGMRVESGGLRLDLRAGDAIYGEMVAEFE
ncbi:actin-like ATPase domain-containing protein [Polychaeton citri CBS 116435]|uniref:Actin-like ATPase domain-containing protein n=1 Tax=Polychaeton citri CBS 116435 TaxID=1314669 RepID=A0A9P4Q4N2_9PEZI|nr:actin-like ATPase domain-containing protein [Polychaeton citri CBS 116435]